MQANISELVKSDVDLQAQIEALQTRLQAQAREAQQAYVSGDLEAAQVLLSRAEETRVELRQLGVEREQRVRRWQQLLPGLDLGFRFGPGRYYSGWSGKYCGDSSTLYCVELSRYQLEALQALTSKRWEQDGDGRLYYRRPEYRDTCWGDSDGLSAARALVQLFPLLQPELEKREAFLARLQGLSVER
jgi:hypothetical protein